MELRVERPSSNRLTMLTHVTRSAPAVRSPSFNSSFVDDSKCGDIDIKLGMSHAITSTRSFVVLRHSNTFVSLYDLSHGTSHCAVCTSFTAFGVLASRLDVMMSKHLRISDLHIDASDKHALIKANLHNAVASHVHAGSHQVSASCCHKQANCYGYERLPIFSRPSCLPQVVSEGCALLPEVPTPRKTSTELWIPSSSCAWTRLRACTLTMCTRKHACPIQFSAHG